MHQKFVVWFQDVDKDDVALVGGKGANLGEMMRFGFPVPPGFIVTVHAYAAFLQENKLEEKIKHILTHTKFEDAKALHKASREITTLILKGKIPDAIIKDIFHAYKILGGIFHEGLVAVRSSATAEDLPYASFAGQQETFLNVKGEANVLLKVKEVWASLFDAKALFYRYEKKIEHLKVSMAVPVQKMIESEKSGILFTIDPVTNDKTKIIIEAIYGLGELIVQGSVTPDHYEVSKQDFKIITKQTATQTKKLVKKEIENKEVSVAKNKQTLQKISDKEIIDLAHLGKMLEKHYYFPQDIEWAIEKKKIYLVQTRPVTTVNREPRTKNQEKGSQLTVHSSSLRGHPASPGIASGHVRIVENANELHKIHTGDILVTSELDPKFIPAMKKAGGIVTDTGHKTSDDARLAQEVGVPTVIGTKHATQQLHDGNVVTVNGTTGEIHTGDFHSIHTQKQKEESKQELLKTATKLYMHVGESAFAASNVTHFVDGALLFSKKHVQKDSLEKELTTFCHILSPHPIIYRLADVHTPEFAIELKALQAVREKKRLRNLWVISPFVRTVQELREIKEKIMATGLHHSHTYKFWLMLEIPAHVIELERFLSVGVDGVCINANNLSRLLRGTDNNEYVVDEQSEATLWTYEKVIKVSHQYNIPSCFYKDFIYPDVLYKLIHLGITSISVSPNMIERTRKYISEVEKKIIA